MLEPHAFTADLCITAFEHSLSKISLNAKRKSQKTSDPSLYDDKEFRGIMLDTGAAKGSTVGEEQFQAYCKFIGRKDYMDRSRTSNCKFGFAVAKGVGIAQVEFPMGTLIFSATFHVVNKPTPFLLCMNDMDRLGTDCLLQVLRPLYGLPESGLHWFQTYHKHHTHTLGMKAAFHDPCFLYFPKSVPGNIQQNAEKEVARGITCIQTDDTINAGNPTHQKAEELYSEKFKRKDAQHLRMGETIEFNGAKIRLLEGNVYSVTISQHVQRLGKCCDTASYVAERARGSYIAAICRPDLAVAFGKAAQVTEPQETV